MISPFRQGRWLLSFALAAASCNACSSSPGKKSEAKATNASAASELSIEPDAGGTVTIRVGDTTIVRSRYLFFGPNYAWAGQQIVTQPPEPDGTLPFTIDVERLGVHIDGKLRRAGDAEIEIEYDITSSTEQRGTSGGGLEFELIPNEALWSRGAKKTELDAANSAFRWPLGQAEAVDVAFEGDGVNVYFERGRPDLVRGFFIPKDISPGQRKVRARIKLPSGSTIRKSLAERYAPPNAETWSHDLLRWDEAPIDLSYLNSKDKPAGALGPIEVRGDEFVRADGTAVKFWGANVAAGALVTPRREDIEAQAKRLAAFGFNLVRLHHHDSGWVRPNVFGNGPDNTRSLSDATLANLDDWVRCLQNEGIYVWIDLHVGREFTANDGITAYEELKSQRGKLEAFNYVNPSIEDRMEEFAVAYLGRKNRFTSRRYAEDPGVLGVLVTNENDLAFHGVRPFVPGSGKREHIKMFRGRALPFMKQARIPRGALTTLPQPGPGKIVLAELEARFEQRTIQTLRDMGYSGPIATTSYWGKAPLYVLPALTVGDVIDTHTYGEAEFLRSNPSAEPNFVSWIAATQVAGMPLTVSEWNVPQARDRFVAPLYFAAIAGLQEWDMTALYVYSQHPFPTPPQLPKWTSLHDPGVMAMMPAAAVMFREGHVAAARQTYRVELPRDRLYGADTSAGTSVALRTLAEQSRIELGLPNIPELDWDTPRPGRETATVVDDLAHDYLEPGATSIRSDTGELERDWGRELHTIDTPRTQAAQGWIGGETVELGNVSVAVSTPKASVAVTSLDGKPLATSGRMLLTVVAQVAASPGDVFPLLSEPVTGLIELQSDRPQLELVPLSGNGQPAASARAVPKVGPRHQVALPAKMTTHWYELREVAAG